MKTIAIANQKGGCGKTTTAINLGAALAKNGKQVLVIDLDPQAHASFALRKDDQSPDSSAYNVLTEKPEKKRPFGSCIVPVSPDLDILPSNAQLSTLEQELNDREDAVSVLRKVLSDCHSYDYALIDCPPSLGFLTFNALRAADWVIIPIDMSPFTLFGVGKLLGMIELVGRKTGRAPQVSALATLFDKRTKYSQSILDEVESFFGDRLLQTVIRHNVALKRAVSEGASVISFYPTSNGARDYVLLAEEIMLCGQHVPEWKQNEAVSGMDMREVTFVIEAPAANEIYLVGEFNDWAADEGSRLLRGENGFWEKRMELPPGTYRYKFLVDGEWNIDHRNQNVESNDFGSFDSIISI
ncbi:MAG TPA: AAA family ATPase [Syntrophales bacterium]|nr:AAA family ATPase [Syntrophales bacterium]